MPSKLREALYKLNWQNMSSFYLVFKDNAHVTLNVLVDYLRSHIFFYTFKTKFKSTVVTVRYLKSNKGVDVGLHRIMSVRYIYVYGIWPRRKYRYTVIRIEICVLTFGNLAFYWFGLFVKTYTFILDFCSNRFSLFKFKTKIEWGTKYKSHLLIYSSWQLCK